ncbi:MAG: ABC transporter ATP-binding protein [Alphaproteobacteria bacterium]|nr:ABC transporter ATP-binding protein [Alphaproteobacteria bacterium]
MNTQHDTAPPRWLWRYLTPQWPALGSGTLAMAVRAGVLALVPWPLKYIIDSVIYAQPLPPFVAQYLPDPHLDRLALLGALCALTLGLGLADALLDYVGNRLFLDAGQRLVFDLRHDLFSHLQKLSLDFHRRHAGGDLMSRLSGDVQKLQDLVSAVGGDFIQNILILVSIPAIMLSVDWRYAVVVMAAFPILAGIIQLYTFLLRRALRRMRSHEGDLWSMAQEVLGSVQLVQACGRESHEEQRFHAGASKLLGIGRGVNSLQAQFSPALTVAVAAATALIAWYGAMHVLDGRITAGEMLVFLAYFRSLTLPTRRVAKTSRMVGRAAVALERIADYLFERPSVVESPLALVPASCAGRVEFEGVSFGYKPGPNILQDISFRLEPGKTVALVGPTGAGKSTITGLISRFYDPVLGRVLLDGHDLRELGLGFLRRQVALVLQEPVILRASVWENICYGLERSTRRDAIAAAEAVGVHHIIERLPGGYDCLVSERGQTLSGGQRQCLSIARAMLSNAPIVVLDEPSSNLDAKTECQLMDAIKRLTASRTSLIIAHRLGTVMEADEILVLDQGRIVQRGRHTQLIRDGGVYGLLWSSSAEGATSTGADASSPVVQFRTAMA